ncbi:hypothetical protein RND81_14G122300 [Saponaria officinalis]|uniref:BHLH domain-containing protein n=1 Tax=Saponaria officinalis TaxID=3572 RepID=A0AAW1GKW5_SAPOF
MLPFQKPCMLSFQNSTIIDVDQNQNNDEDNILMDYGDASSEVGTLNPSNNQRKGGRGRGRGRGSSSTINSAACSSNTISATNGDQQRKIIHREIERQRRQEMSNLYGSLRSTLPHDYIKGKKSTSDQLEEAVNYIKDLKKNLKELKDKRDYLKTSIESTSSRHKGGVGGLSGNSTPCPGSVVMFPRRDRLDIEINVGYEKDGFSLSIALQVILDEGLGIASYTSTKVDYRFVHNIVCEVSNMACIDIDGLQQRLIVLVC